MNFIQPILPLVKRKKFRFDFQKGDTEGIVNYALSIKGIIFGVIFIEDEEQEMIKISFRSKGSFSVNQFSRSHFEGGGHGQCCGVDHEKIWNKPSRDLKVYYPITKKY
jgi:phosphoesterase RecJ-like protein